MSINKICSFLSIAAFSIAGIAFAKNCGDFCQNDFDRIIRGEKDFTGAKLQGAKLNNMDLRGVVFKQAELEEANLQCSDLRGANFTDADLEEANLKGANIEGATFKGAELEYAIWINGRVCAEGSVGGCW